MPKVSVIMPVYNAQDFIGGAIESVLNQTYSDWELICVDDGSTDGSKNVICSFNNNKIRCIFQEHSGKPSCARNTGIKNSQGEYIAFLDSDDIYRSDSLSKRIEYFQTHPNAVFVYSDCEVIDDKNRMISDSMISWSGKKAYEGHCFKELFVGIFIPTMGVMLKRSILDKVGLFNEKLIGCEDYELWLRISYYFPLNYLSQTMAKCKIRNGSLTTNSLMMDESFFNCLKFILNLFSDCYNFIGKEIVKRRMYNLSIDVAFQYLHRGEWRRARQWLKEAWYWGRKPKTLIQILITYCTPIAQRHWSVSTSKKHD